MRSRLYPLFLVLLGFGAFQTAAVAEPLPKPTGPVILTVDGLIGQTNDGGSSVFDLKMLQGLGARTLWTTSEWTEGKNTFKGVLMRDLLRAVLAQGNEVVAAARDEYAVVIPISEFERYDAILVYEMNGKPLDPADKGHLWIMYPWDVMPAQEIEEKKSNAVWQLNRITVE